MTNDICDSNEENNKNTVEIGIYIASQMELPEGWKVTKAIKDYDITHPNGSTFSGDIDSLAGYLGIRIYYNIRIYQGKTEFKCISSVDDNIMVLKTLVKTKILLIREKRKKLN